MVVYTMPTLTAGKKLVVAISEDMIELEGWKMDHYLNAKHNTGKKGFVDTARTMFLLPVDCTSQWSVLLIYILRIIMLSKIIR
jgi:hypothetical protein